MLLGGGVRGEVRVAPALTLRIDAIADGADVARSVGQVAVETFSAGAGLGWSLDGRSLRVVPWIGARGGVGRLRGVPGAGTTGTAQSGAWTGPEAGVEVVVGPRETLHVALALSGGVALVGPAGQVSGGADVDLRGPWAMLLVGLGFAIP